MRLPRISRISAASAQHVLAAEQHLAADGARRALGQQAHDRQRGQALAAARFADQAQHLATAQREADAVDRLHHAAAQEEMRVQVAHLEDGVCRS